MTRDLRAAIRTPGRARSRRAKLPEKATYSGLRWAALLGAGAAALAALGYAAWKKPAGRLRPGNAAPAADEPDESVSPARPVREAVPATELAEPGGEVFVSDAGPVELPPPGEEPGEDAAPRRVRKREREGGGL